MIPESLHLLRPEWLLALLPAAAIVAMVLRRSLTSGQDGWARFVDPHLLKHLAVGGRSTVRFRLGAALLGGALLAMIIGLAGPTWRQIEIPAYDGGEPTVVVMSLAQSMNTADLTPSRLTRSVHKLRDILGRTRGDDVGLVIYADRPFTAAPLTNDSKVIEAMLPELSTSLMPVLGNRLDLAIDEAHSLLTQAGAESGGIVVIADGTGSAPEKSIDAAASARGDGYTLSVLGAGTEDGGVLQTRNGTAIRDQAGGTVETRLELDNLTQLAEAGGGGFSVITPTDADLDRVLADGDSRLHAAGAKQDFTAEAWADMGYWLLLIPLLLAPLAFRRGLIMSLILVSPALLMQPSGAEAETWDNLWQTPDQQGQAAFEAGDFSRAASSFESPDWKASAAYRADDFAAAAADYARLSTPDQDYNLGNALAKSGDLEGALKAYDEALAANPDDADAQFNRDLVAKLLDQQQQDQQQQDQQKQDQQQQDQQQQDQQQQDQQQQDQQQQDQQQQDQQQQDQQKQDQQQQDQQQGEKQQDQQQGQQQQGEQQQDQQQPGEQQNANATDQEDSGELSDTLDRLLDDKGEPTAEEPEVSADLPGMSEHDQAIEQQLRRVPDDPSGLLRARIRQHYARLRATSPSR